MIHTSTRPTIETNQVSMTLSMIMYRFLWKYHTMTNKRWIDDTKDQNRVKHGFIQVLPCRPRACISIENLWFGEHRTQLHRAHAINLPKFTLTLVMQSTIHCVQLLRKAKVVKRTGESEYIICKHMFEGCQRLPWRITINHLPLFNEQKGKR